MSADERLAAVLAEAWRDEWADRPNDVVMSALAAAIQEAGWVHRDEALRDEAERRVVPNDSTSAYVHDRVRRATIRAALAPTEGDR